MRHLALLVPIIGLLTFTLSAQAQTQAQAKTKTQAKTLCFTEAELKAEQAIRLHTDLMVIGLTCGEPASKDTPNLFARYREFTDRHQVAVRGWEKAMIGHFKRVGKGSATKNFDSYRTSLANETSRRAIALSNPVFCAAFVPRAEKVLGLDAAALAEALTQDTAVLRIASLPRCDKPMQPLQVAQEVGPAPTNAAPVPGAAAR